MTAPLLNLPIASPFTGPSPAQTGQEPAAGFEALLAAFFVTPGEAAPQAPLGEAQSSEEDPGAQQVTADVNPALSTEAQALAAMQVVPTAPPVVQTPGTATSEDEPAGAPTGSTATAPAPFPLPGPAATTTPAAPAPAQSVAPQAAPQPELAALAQPEPQRPTAAATDPDVALPVAGQASEASEVENSVKATPAAPAPSAPPTTSAALPPPAQPASPPAPIAPPTTPTVMTQAQAPAGDTPLEPEAAPPQAPARNAKSDTAARGVAQGARPASTGETVLPTAMTSAPNATSSGQAASAVETDRIMAPRPAASEAAADAPESPAPLAPAPTSAAQAAAPAAHAAPVRATPETVAHLAAHIANKLDGHSTKFDIELNPAGLGRVSVSVEIAASGKMTAAMSFDNPQAAAELRGRSNEIQRALEQAGFDLSGGLSFDVAGDRGDGRGAPQQQQNDGAAWRGRAFQAVLGTAGEAVEAASSLALNHGRRPATGVDVRI